jgi:hypothetical protein
MADPIQRVVRSLLRLVDSAFVSTDYGKLPADGYIVMPRKEGPLRLMFELREYLTHSSLRGRMRFCVQPAQPI